MDVSIIIIGHKCRGFIKEAEQSANNQIFNSKFEVIKYIGTGNFATNANIASQKAKGKYLKFLADDDKLTPDCIQKLFDEAESGNYDVVFANYLQLKEGFAVTPLKMPFEQYNKDWKRLLIDKKLPSGTALIKKSSFDEVLGFNESYNIAEGYILFSKMLRVGLSKFSYIDENLYIYRIHDNQKSLGLTAEKQQSRKDEMTLIELNYGTF